MWFINIITNTKVIKNIKFITKQKIYYKLEEKIDQEQFLQFEQKVFKKSNLYKIRINFIEKNKANYCNFTLKISKVSF